MKYWFDTEFIDDGKTIDLISIGIVSEDHRTYYAETTEYNISKASEWVKQNVGPQLGYVIPKSRRLIAAEIITFIGKEQPEFWAYYASYDWVALCQLYGTMMEVPPHFPMYCRDLQQMVQHLGYPLLPIQDTPEHHALNDAIWCKQAWTAIYNRWYKYDLTMAL